MRRRHVGDVDRRGEQRRVDPVEARRWGRRSGVRPGIDGGQVRARRQRRDDLGRRRDRRSGRRPVPMRAAARAASDRSGPPTTAATPSAPGRSRNERRDRSGAAAGCRRRRRGRRDRVEAGEPGQDLDPDARPTAPPGPRPWPGWPVARRARPGSRRAEGQEADRRRGRTSVARAMPRTGPDGRPRRATTTTSRASLSFVPNRATTKSLAPGGWRSMTTWPTAATSDVAPGRRPAMSSDTPEGDGGGDRAGQRRAAAGHAWRTGLDMEGRARRRGHRGAWCPVSMTFACHASVRRARAVHRPSRDSTARSQTEGRGQQVGAEDLVDRPGAGDRAVAQHEDVIEAGGISSRWWVTRTMAVGRAVRGERRQVVEQASRGRPGPGSPPARRGTAPPGPA